MAQENGSDFSAYQKAYYDYMGVTVSIPDEYVTYDSVTKEDLQRRFARTMHFADMTDRSIGNFSVFVVGPIVCLDSNSVILLDGGVMYNTPIRPGHQAPINNGLVRDAAFVGSMLNNLKLPWFHYDHDLEIQNDAALMQKINTATRQNAKVYTDHEWLLRTNSRQVGVVLIPEFHLVECGDSALMQQIRQRTDVCYGIDFYRPDRYMPVKMLVFIKKGVGNIDAYVDKISRYIRFDPDFKFE